VRTFVISDAHGCPEIIQNALRHGGFEPGQDAFVYAGDLLDRGPDADGCLSLVEQYATEVLLGNHDVAALLSLYVLPQNPESPAFGPLLADRVTRPGRSGAWKAATCVEGVLVTNAGVSEDYERIFVAECHSDPAVLAARLNAEFLALVRRKAEIHDWSDHELLGDLGPFWFRPWPYSHLHPLRGCVQVVGHTPALGDIGGPGFRMIDPTSFEEWDDPGRFRYAIIERGSVRVEEGALMRSGSPTAGEKPHGAVQCGLGDGFILNRALRS